MMIGILSGAIADRVFSTIPGIGNVTPCTGCSFNVPNGSLSPSVGTPNHVYENVNGTVSNSTIRFLIAGLEPTTPLVYSVSTSGVLTLVYITASQPKVTCVSCTSAYTANPPRSQLVISYSGGVSAETLVILWSQPAFTTEQKQVIFLDDFLYQNPMLSSLWTVDLYQSPSRAPGEYTVNGFLGLTAKSSSGVETAHVNNPAYSPSQYSDNVIVKRKLTASLYPFQKQENNTANIKIGITPLLASGTYPGSTPQGTPFVDPSNNCSGGTSAIGSEYLVMDNSGTVTAVACGDGQYGRSILSTTLDPTLYSVFTVEFSGVYCSTCTDHVFPGTSWVWFRVYQNDKNSNIITASDKNVNMTSQGAPLYQTSYIFASQQSNPTPGVTTYIDLVQLQNYGSPVCLFGCIPPIFDKLPGPLSSTWAALLNIATWLGQGDLGFGSLMLFGIFMAIPLLSYAGTRSVLLVSAETIMILGIFLTSGLFGSIWIFAVVLSMAYLAWGIIRKMFLSGGGMSGGDDST